jgi:hypothetical protein
MKYIITESRLENIIFKYLDNKLDGIELKEGEYCDIIFVFPGEKFGLMGWKKSNQLFTYWKIIDDIETMFSMDVFDAHRAIGRYVESRYNLKVSSDQVVWEPKSPELRIDR